MVTASNGSRIKEKKIKNKNKKKLQMWTSTTQNRHSFQHYYGCRYPLLISIIVDVDNYYFDYYFIHQKQITAINQQHLSTSTKNIYHHLK